MIDPQIIEEINKKYNYPIVYVDELGKTTAELSMEEKNKISHRGNALRKMKEILGETLNGKV